MNKESRNNMQYVRLGKTELNVSRISFGTIPILNGPFEIMTSYHNLTQKETDDLIRYALEKGINFFDTATNFEYSDAEEKLGNSIKHLRENIILSSKARAYDKDSMTKSVINSLKMLKTDYIDIFFIHQINPKNLGTVMDEKNGALKALEDFKKNGYIRHIGIATHHASVVNEIVKYRDFDVLQLPLNVLECGFYKYVESELKEKDIGTIGMKIFGGGLLSEYFSANTLINYALSTGINSALIGFGDKKQIDDAINAINNANSIDYAKIQEIKASKLNGYYCTRCQKCFCKNGIEIHKILRYRTFYLLGKKEWAIKQYNRKNIVKECDNCNMCIPLCEEHLPIPNLLEDTKKLLGNKGENI